MSKKKIGHRCMDILLVLINLLFLIGLRTFASACAMKDDGTWMTCHYAMQALFGIAAVLLADAVLNLVQRNEKTKAGLMIAMIPTALLGAILPGNLIGLCMMDTMHCHTVMRPFAVLMSALNIILAAIGLIRNARMQ